MANPRFHRPTRARSIHGSLRIGVTGNNNELIQARAKALANELSLPWFNPSSPGFDLHLKLTPERLELKDARNPSLGPVSVDYGFLDLRSDSANLSRRQPLARAMGKKTRSVVDATAGYGQDALLLALMGFSVIAIERSPVVAALARDGLQRFIEQTGMKLFGRLQQLTGDSRSLLPGITPPPDAIYLDPMFPPKRRKSAAVKKEMRLLRELVGDDADAPELLELCRALAIHRVVVKRPDDAPPLAPNPSMSLEGKLVRYDVYLTNLRNPK